MIKAYIAHPYRGASGSREEIKANIGENEKICRAIITDESFVDISPISPLTGFSFFDEDYPEYKIMRHCYTMLNGCNEVWVFGEWESSLGVVKEISYAIEIGKPVKFFDFIDSKITELKKIRTKNEFCDLLIETLLKERKKQDERI
ncbi:DUF4406 domain-containing protein [Synergistes jonesii]|uniref:DUF4406 domain-containing protein n=1 Tax=Synergistes jonesii TaxID=2754 RepID=UPI003317FF5B